MCKCGKHNICVDTKYKTIDTIRTVCGVAGVVLFSTGNAVMSSVDVVVGKVPFAWLLGSVVAIAGIAFCAAVATVDMKNRLYRMAFALFMVAAGVYNVIDNPRAEVICPCLPGYYGSDASGFMDKCLPCRCGNGTCMETIYGDGTCSCPARYDPVSTGEACTACVPGAEGDSCERCKVGWKFPECTECYPGYEEPCDFTATGVINHTCKKGWKTECAKTSDMSPLPPWSSSVTNCSVNTTYNRTVRCDVCDDGYNGRDCTPCPNCTKNDPVATCLTNRRTPNPTLSTVACYDDYDCDSFQCVGNKLCANEIRERTGCKCSAGFAGPACEPCVEYTVDVGETCVKGTCLYNPVIEEPYCFCESDYVAPIDICSQNVNGECEPGYWGDQCKRCNCANGICDDGRDGNGNCSSCYNSEWGFDGLGMWDGPQCRSCAPGPLKVGCGDKCSPTPAWQVEFSNKSMWYGQTCGEVQRCDRNGIGPCLRDCLANGTDGTDCPTRKIGNSVQLDRTTCELTSGPDWYKCTPITCDDKPCKHGNCTGIGSFSCDCDTGWSGDTCDQDVDECTGEPCMHGTCVNSIGSFSCTCDTGWSGDTCDQDVDECTGTPCVHGTCANNIGSFSCDCDTGWEGDTCDQDVDECTGTPCVHGTCANSIGSFSCDCDIGWEGDTCSTDIDECDGQSCSGHGTCTESNSGTVALGEYSCACDSDENNTFSGTDCECHTKSECNYSPNTYCCNLDIDLEPKLQCMPGWCLCDGICTTPAIDGVCNCPDNSNKYTLREYGTCPVAIATEEECLTAGHVTFQTLSTGYPWNGRYMYAGNEANMPTGCSKSVYSADQIVFNNQTTTVACTPERPCACANPQDVDECAGTPCVHGTCANNIGSFSCDCDTGWEGDTCDQDVDECTGTPCVHGTCANSIGSFSCDCDTGWEGDTCSTDIDECAGQSCSGNGTCTDSNNGTVALGEYSCACDSDENNTFSGTDCECHTKSECNYSPNTYCCKLDTYLKPKLQCMPGWCLCDGICTTPAIDGVCNCPDNSNKYNLLTSGTCPVAIATEEECLTAGHVTFQTLSTGYPWNGRYMYVGNEANMPTGCSKSVYTADQIVFNNQTTTVACTAARPCACANPNMGTVCTTDDDCDVNTFCEDNECKQLSLNNPESVDDLDLEMPL